MADAKTEKQKVKEITDKLEEGLKELFESGKYKNYLSTMSKFHNYSVNNTLLIALQRPDASLVAGYQAWQKNFNRHVNKGEKGIRILAPAPYKIKEERDKLDPVTGEIMLDQDGMPQTEEVEIKIPAFRAVSVFDVKQTSGEPIPELEAKELLSTVEGYEDKTTSSFIEIARKYFAEYGYFDVLAVLDSVQKDIAAQIEKAALKSNDPWQQLIFGCVGFVNCANAKPNRRILLVDAPSVLGWDTWRKIDQENSMRTLQEQINDLKAWGYLCDDVDTSLMTCSVSGALNELALNYSQDDAVSTDRKIFDTISQLVNGFRRKKC